MSGGLAIKDDVKHSYWQQMTEKIIFSRVMPKISDEQKKKALWNIKRRRLIHWDKLNFEEGGGVFANI